MAGNSLAFRRLSAILFVLLSMGLLASIQNVSAQGSQIYRNSKFGFSLAIPPRFHLCESSNATTDHGIMIPLGNGMSCDENREGSSIDIFAGFNSAYIANTAEQLARHVCAYPSERTLVSVQRAPKELSFKGKDTFTCKEILDGKVELRLITLIVEQTPPPSWTHFEVDLFSTKAKLGDDTKALKAIIANLTFDR